MKSWMVGKINLLLSLLLVSLEIQAQTYTIGTVPNVKVDSNNYVSNPDRILRLETVREIDQRLRDLETKTSAQVAVVVLTSIGDQDIFTFAQELFTAWGIGTRGKDNGLLILLVMDRRTVRLHVGQGLEGILPDIICKQIEEQDMVPKFKIGQNDEAMLAGVDHVIRILSDPVYANEILDKELRSYSEWDAFFPVAVAFGSITLLLIFMKRRGKFSDSKKPLPTPYPGMRLSKGMWLLEFGLVPFGILLIFKHSPMISPIPETLAAIYGYSLLTLIHKRVRMETEVKRFLEAKKYKRIVDFFEEYRISWLVWGILFPLPLLPHYFMYRRRMTGFRNHPRDCEKCGKPAHKLDEQTDDNYLSKEQIFEEGLKSVDYDIWLCDSCGTYFELMYQNKASKYSLCPKCKAHAFYQKSNRTLVSPTESSSGEGERTHECKFCSHTAVTTYSISKLSSSRSSSSGSSSSGGSFGGGSSGGGGASSSW